VRARIFALLLAALVTCDARAVPDPTYDREQTRGILNLAGYGARMDGSTSCYPYLAALVADYGGDAQGKTIVIPGVCYMSAGIAIPDTLPVRFEGGRSGFVGPGAASMSFRTHDGVINVRRDFAAKGNYTSDDTTAVLAAIAVAAAQGAPTGGTVFFPPGNYRITQTLALKDSVSLIGASRRGTYISTDPATFTGDSAIRAYRRDDNQPNSFDAFRVENIAVSVNSGIVGIDLTGSRGSIVKNVNLMGPGPAVVGSLAIRVSDKNPTGTSSKTCFFNRITSVEISGSGWETAIYLEDLTGNASSNYFGTVNASARTGLAFGTFTTSAATTFVNCYMTAQGAAPTNGYSGAIPINILFERFDLDGFTVNNGITPSPTTDLMIYGYAQISTLWITSQAKYSSFGDTSGTPGNAAVDAAVGKSAIAAGTSTVTITNSVATATSMIIVVLQTNDATAILKNVVPGVGNFTVNLTANATGNTNFAWFIVNHL
jgi:Pectate lyase superfamily protein